jgi:MSHA pilin protein MshD
MTLIELMVAIVVIALAGTVLVGTLTYLAGSSSTAMAQAQAQSIANAYLNEILGKSFDPLANTPGVRALFNDVGDYDGLDTLTATDERGNPAGNFHVQVSVVPGSLNLLPASDVRRIDVTVTDGTGSQVLASGYRTKYPNP